MKLSLAASALLLLGACTASLSAAVPEPPKPLQAEIVWVASGDFCEPETVLVLPDDSLLVSNVCGFSTPDTGYLSLLDGQGKIIDGHLVTGLDAPLGMTFHADQIYVIDANQVKAFSWPGFAAGEVIALNTTVANDITASPSGVLYISDTATGRVTELAPNQAPQELVSDTLFSGANGIEFGPDGALYVGGERLWRVDLATGTAEAIGPAWLSDIDGIAFEAGGTVQVTPVGGPLIRLHPDGAVEVLSGEGVSSTNHGYAATLNLALIPTGYDNTVIALRVGE